MAFIVVLDDERIVRNLVSLIVRQMRHSVRQAGTPEEAEQICHDHPTDLLLADVKLAGGRSGTEFALALARVQPRIKCLFICGLPIENWSHRDQLNMEDMPEGSYSVLCKPISTEVLLKAIDDLLSSSK